MTSSLAGADQMMDFRVGLLLADRQEKAVVHPVRNIPPGVLRMVVAGTEVHAGQDAGLTDLVCHVNEAGE